jgi:hypothetical protein
MLQPRPPKLDTQDVPISDQIYPYDVPRTSSQFPTAASGGRLLPRFDDDFRDRLLLVSPYFIHSGRFFQGDPMRDDVARINLSPLNAIEKGLHVVLHVGLAHFHGDALAEGPFEHEPPLQAGRFLYWRGSVLS